MDRIVGALLLGFVLTLTGCPPLPEPDPPAPPPRPHSPTATCASVCDAWADLKCLEAEPTPAGVECPEVCETSAAGWDLGCLEAVTSCDQIDACPETG